MNPISRQVVEANSIEDIIELHRVAVERTEEFLVDKPGYKYEISLWFGSPSFLELIIFQDED